MVVAALFAILTPIAPGADVSGETFYKQECARCHGKSGQGTKKYPQPLIGEKSAAQLASLIGRTMPDDDPGSCTKDQSRGIAQYIYDAFYSTDARAKMNPPRVELAHLTVGQYRNVVADIIGSFRDPVKQSREQGLHGEYYNARNFDRSKRLIDRLNPQVDFDFGDVGPAVQSGKQEFDPNQFSLHWQGSVFAPETGVYDFIIRTDQSGQMWVNDMRKPVVDALIKSGSDNEYRGSILLLGGRSYSLKLEVYKRPPAAKKGTAPKPSHAFFALAWKRPHLTDEVIPARFLTPVKSQEVAVMETPFPPDDRSLGWERGTIVSKEWYSATTEGAIEVARYVSERIEELSGSKESAKDRVPKLRAFCQKFAERAFRRPLSAEENKQFIDTQFETVSDPGLALKRVVLLVMTSPRFLYPGATDTQGPYAVASRLAMALWDSLPDQKLLDAAATEKLSTREQIAAQADRMLADPRAHAKVRQFLMSWLRVDQFPEIVKDPERFAGFDSAVAADLRTSLELFLDDIVWNGSSDFRQFFLSDEYFLNARLGDFYGLEIETEAGFTKVQLDPEQRAGVLTHPYMLSVLAYPGESSPIHRGVFVGRGLLGITLRPPPNAFTPLAPELHPNLTTRERITLQTSAAACVRCHGVINPLGFALENFDAVGRFRTMERGKAIDVNGFYETREGPTVKFTGARQLAAYLAGSEEVQSAFSQQLFQHLVKQPVRAYGLQKPQELQQFFARSGFSVRKLLVECAVIAAGS